MDLTGSDGATAGEGREHHPAHLAPARLVVAGPPGAARVPPSTGLAASDIATVDPPTGIRRRLILDAALLLGGVAAIVLVVSTVAPVHPTGAVLGVTTDGMATAGTIIGPGPAASAVRATLVPSKTTSSATPASGSPGPTAEPASLPSAGSTPPGASAANLAVLVPCPGRSGCYLYLVRRGDYLTRIADRFGVSASAILAMNPWIVDPSIIVTGSTLRIPTPTR